MHDLEVYKLALARDSSFKNSDVSCVCFWFHSLFYFSFATIPLFLHRLRCSASPYAKVFVFGDFNIQHHDLLISQLCSNHAHLDICLSSEPSVISTVTYVTIDVPILLWWPVSVTIDIPNDTTSYRFSSF